ncbi:uncharacterized protein LOC100565269 [Anolis carolinensis]|uniref:uncharacterized protein LOC100565269 n=1 Tax=Anolis carolinensis TaxID=28377 RepID=UPI002F2B8861
MSWRKPLLLAFLVASLYFVSGSRIRDQATFELPDEFEDDEPMEKGQFQPDITVLRKGSVAPEGSYMSRAIEDSNKVLSSILRDPQALRIIQERLAQKKMKRWAHYKTKGKTFKKGRARFVRDVGKAAKLRLLDKHVSVFKKLRKRRACMTKLQNGGDTTERFLAQEGKHRCARSSDVGDKETETHTNLRSSKGSQRGKAEGDENDSVAIFEKKQVLKERRKRAISAEKSDFLSPNPSQSYYSPTTTAQRASLKRRKRSISLLLTKDKHLDKALLGNLLKTQEEGSRENTQTGTHRNKREAKKLSIQMIHLTLTALKTQEKLSTMVDYLSDPSNNMSEEEKYNYTQELLSELSAFVKLLQQQVTEQSQQNITEFITSPTPQT